MTNAASALGFEPISAPDHPTAPATLAEAGLGVDLVVQIVLKTLHFGGQLSGAEVANRLGIPFSTLEPAIDALIRTHQIEISGGTMIGRVSYLYRITDAGRTRAALFLDTNQYVGAAPVPIEQYRAYLKRFEQRAKIKVTRDTVRHAFDDLVLNERVINKLGPAINSGHSLFVFGPPGNGKTVISQSIRKLLGGDIFIPHAIEVEGQIIRVFDPVNHEPLDATADEAGLVPGNTPDRRWVRCRRPLITVGGELTMRSLDLGYSDTTHVYSAPLQVSANGGVLVLDDFGRQSCTPRELLNRWIVPLENRVDYLTLQSGQKVEFPFDALIVFATNIKPEELVDEAFLRRIQYKIFAQSPTPEEFEQIFENYCRLRGVHYDPTLVQWLFNHHYHPRHLPLRAVHPRDLISQALSLAEYLGEPPVLTPDLLDEACKTYFVDDGETPPVYV